MANMLRALEAHVALFGMFDDPATEATIKKAIDKQKVPEMSKKKLARKERDNLPDSAFGLPKMRKYPLTDPDRVKNAIKYFKFCGKCVADAIFPRHDLMQQTAEYFFLKFIHFRELFFYIMLNCHETL